MERPIMAAFSIAFHKGHRLDKDSKCMDCGKKWSELKNVDWCEADTKRSK